MTLDELTAIFGEPTPDDPPYRRYEGGTGHPPRPVPEPRSSDENAKEKRPT